MPPDADWHTCNDPSGSFTRPVGQPPSQLVSSAATMEGYRNIVVTYGDAASASGRPSSAGPRRPVPIDQLRVRRRQHPREQAACTVRAYQMGKNWGWVGPMFLWNLNFNVVAPARSRPSGASSTLAGVRCRSTAPSPECPSSDQTHALVGPPRRQLAAGSLVRGAPDRAPRLSPGGLLTRGNHR